MDSLPPPPLRLLPAVTTSCRVGITPTENPNLSQRTLGQGLTAREAIHRGVGTQAERDAALPNPSKGDEWFNTDLAGGGKWEKHTGTDWKRS